MHLVVGASEHLEAAGAFDEGVSEGYGSLVVGFHLIEFAKDEIVKFLG